MIRGPVTVSVTINPQTGQLSIQAEPNVPTPIARGMLHDAYISLLRAELVAEVRAAIAAGNGQTPGASPIEFPTNKRMQGWRPPESER